MMHEHGQSDGCIVPEKSPNEPGRPGAEGMEGRQSAKGNARESHMPRAQDRMMGMPPALERIRAVVRRDKGERLVSLYHHVYNVDHLREAYLSLNPKAAPGVDQVTWREYGQDLEGNLQDLSGRLRRGAYRARPVERVYIPKADGRQRPLGKPAMEDKIVQRVVAGILSVVWEEEFLGFSYGFRPGRNPHQALDALTVGITVKRVSWVLDADIRGFYDTINHEWLVKFIEHRIGDRRVVRLIQKWLKAGVLEDGKWRPSEEGTPQGGVISPVLANIYLHYAFDQWVQHWRTRKGRGDVVVVRYADDFVLGLERRSEAEQFQKELVERLRRFGLELHAEKTRLIEFGRFAASNRARRGEGKPETFTFLGFTHICGRSRRGRFVVVRQTVRKRMRAKLQQVKRELRRRRHEAVPEQGRWLASVLRGHYQYYGVSLNGEALAVFRNAVIRTWKRALERRSQRGRVTWERMSRLTGKWLPSPRIYHRYPASWIRSLVTT